MNIQKSLIIILTAPSPASLWQLRGDLLQAGLPREASAWSVLDKFFEFLNELSASVSAQEYSKLATLLDIGAVGGVALQNLIESDISTADLWKRLLVGGAGEGLMVLASRQYVKAFEAEMTAVYQSAAWYLYQELWRLSAQFQPDLEAGARRQLIESLLAPILQEEVTGLAQAVLIGRLFQVLLLIHLDMSLKKLEIGDLS